MNDWNRWLGRWAEAGLIDAGTAGQIRDYETAQRGATGLRWPIVVALGFGGLMVAGGVLLFVAAHWDALSPGQRFGLVLLMVAGFHVAGALTAERFPGMAATLHAVGTAALGGGIALAGQIFNLAEHWPGGILLWALGALAGCLLLRQVPQLVLLAILTPAWLVGEWMVRAGSVFHPVVTGVAACGVLLCALSYLTATSGAASDDGRRALQWLGVLALPPAALLLALTAEQWAAWNTWPATLPANVYRAGWIVAIGVPLLLAIALRRQGAVWQVVASVWAIGAALIDSGWWLYVWWAVGAIGLVAWGVRDARAERVNLGAALFAATVITFYFSQVMDKLGRSLSLVAFGVLFLVGGWALERMRRRLMVQVREAL